MLGFGVLRWALFFGLLDEASSVFFGGLHGEAVSGPFDGVVCDAADISNQAVGGGVFAIELVASLFQKGDGVLRGGVAVWFHCLGVFW